ncbi:hypothetical protein Y1Q_0016550 [Alligator mississippiensis]|uniref:Uncharacterized protein n=1 Tax=Alligator mississippiensis TaxID=8496 RepID=A0A151N322_ALLMI|nr:hypothetical protein Y1Q_0016550 [Alligator mississippiensis]
MESRSLGRGNLKGNDSSPETVHSSWCADFPEVLLTERKTGFLMDVHCLLGSNEAQLVMDRKPFLHNLL